MTFRIAIFASGEGTNAQRFIDYFGTTGNPVKTGLSEKEKNMVVSLLISDNPSSKALERAKRAGIAHLVVSAGDTRGEHGTMGLNTEVFTDFLKRNVDFIVLAGFLKLIPLPILKAFKDRIVNIHPALLPKYGGKGMYGNRVHEAVIANKERKSGITIHLVNERYDEGKIIFQKECLVNEDDTVQSLAAKIHELEHRYYPETVEKFIRSLPV